MTQNVPFQHFPVVCICWTSTCMCPAYVALGISACKPEAIFARIQLPTALCGASVTTYVPSDHDQLSNFPTFQTSHQLTEMPAARICITNLFKHTRMY